MAKTFDQELHSLSPYAFRCYNGGMEGKREQRYSTLDKIGPFDLFHLLDIFIQNNSGAYTILEDSKQVYRFSDIHIEKEERTIYAWFDVGTYGMRTDIIDVDTGEISYEKTETNAEIIKHYVHFHIPVGVNEAFAFMHAYRGNGVKTLFFDMFSNFFTAKTTFILQMNPLAYDKAINAWLDASAKEIKLTRFTGSKDITDQIKHLGHEEYELEYSIKSRRNKSLGKLRDYISPQKNEATELIEIMSEFSSSVKTVVELNGKKRTFNLGVRSSNALCSIELDENVVLDDGVPLLDSMNRWVEEIVTEYVEAMYPDRKVEVV